MESNKFEKKNDSEMKKIRENIEIYAAIFRRAITNLCSDNTKLCFLLGDDNRLPSMSSMNRLQRNRSTQRSADDAKLVTLTVWLLNNLDEPEGLFLWRAYFSPSRKHQDDHEGYSRSSYYRNLNKGMKEFTERVQSTDLGKAFNARTIPLRPESDTGYTEDTPERDDLDKSLNSL